MTAGLCDTCAHQRIVKNTRGSRFSLCGRSKDEPDRFPRYPRTPVTACPGYAEKPPGATSRESSSPGSS